MPVLLGGMINWRDVFIAVSQPDYFEINTSNVPKNIGGVGYL